MCAGPFEIHGTQSPSRPATPGEIIPLYILLLSVQLISSGEGQEGDGYGTVFSFRSVTN